MTVPSLNYLNAALPMTVSTPATNQAGNHFEFADIKARFAAGLEVQKPTVLAREDGERLFYSNALNSVIGESEHGKTWMALLAAKQEIQSQRKVLFIDYEDTVEQVLLRLIAMEVTEGEILAWFDYVSPSGSVNDAVHQALEERNIDEYSLVVIDGVTEAMSMQGNLSGRDEGEVAAFYNVLPKWLAEKGPAVVLIDHVSKSRDPSDTSAIGSQHKKAGITGASYLVKADKPFSKKFGGKSKVYVAKDKRGGVDCTQEGGMRFAGFLHVDPDAVLPILEVFIDMPATSSPATGGSISKIDRIRQMLVQSARAFGKPVQAGTLTSDIKIGNAREKSDALKWLKDNGNLKLSHPDGRTNLYAWAKDYEPEDA